MADVAQLLVSASPAIDGDAITEQSDGVVVLDALPDAERVPVAPGLQGVVLEPYDGHDRGVAGV